MDNLKFQCNNYSFFFVIQLQGWKRCLIFNWCDEKMTEHSQEVINSFLKKANDSKKNDGLTKNVDDDLKKKIKFLVVFILFFLAIGEAQR